MSILDYFQDNLEISKTNAILQQHIVEGPENRRQSSWVQTLIKLLVLESQIEKKPKYYKIVNKSGATGYNS
jgi:hypothetical protein